MVYKAGIGNNLATGSLTTLDPQPRSTGVQTTRRSYAADATIYEESPFCILEWNIMEDDDAYVDILEVFGLDTALVSPVTVRLKSQFFADTLYNGTAVRPDHGREVGRDYFPRNVQILVRDLEQLVEA